MSTIPKVLHYCFGLSSNFGRKPWSLVHYACVKSAIQRIRPEATFLYYDYEPTGPWWELTKPLLETVKVEAPRQIFGRGLKHAAHRADVLRLQKLIEYGGIYLDCDVFVHRDFDDLLDHSFVISRESERGLSNAALLAERDAPFARRWYEEYRSFRGEQSWTEHSITLPLRLADQFPREVNVLPQTAFCWPLHFKDHLKWIFESGQPPLSHNAYGNHLWETLTWVDYLEHLTPGRVRSTVSHFHEWVKPFISDLPDDFGAPSLAQKYNAALVNSLRQIKNRWDSGSYTGHGD